MKQTIFMLLMVVLAACGSPRSQIQPITSVPTNTTAPTQAASDTPVIAATPTLMPTTEPTATQPTVIDSTAEPASPTPEPLNTNLPEGNARQVALATDTALRLTPRASVSFDAGPVLLTFDEFYDGYNIRTGLILSDKLLALDGRQVTLQGYMAPPLKPEIDFFVLTSVRLAFCPFCSSASDWPDDVALVYMPPGETTIASEYPLQVTGQLEVGVSVDQETGMVSLVRVYADRLETLS